MTPSIYTALERRIFEIQKAVPCDTEGHRKLVLMLVELADMVMPSWNGEETTPASCIRVAKTFGDGGKVNWGNTKQLRQRVFGMERRYTYPTAPLESLLVGVAGDVLNSLYNPLNAKAAVDRVMLAYVEANFGSAPASVRASFARHAVLSDEFEAKALVIIERYFPQG